MKNVTLDFKQLFEPSLALLVYQHAQAKSSCYVEAYDIAPDGRPVNARPLNEEEANELATVLRYRSSDDQAFLRPTGLMPDSVLHLNALPNEEAVIWYTPQMRVNLYFTDSLGIPNGQAHVPALLWSATRSDLRIFALPSKSRPTAKTPLYHAPFFNLHPAGNVCMGSVDINLPSSTSLQGFIKSWQSFFFNSKFSHLMAEHNPIEGNVVQLWQSLINTDQRFPNSILKKSRHTLQSIIR